MQRQRQGPPHKRALATVVPKRPVPKYYTLKFNCGAAKNLMLLERSIYSQPDHLFEFSFAWVERMLTVTSFESLNRYQAQRQGVSLLLSGPLREIRDFLGFVQKVRLRLHRGAQELAFAYVDVRTLCPPGDLAERRTERARYFLVDSVTKIIPEGLGKRRPTVDVNITLEPTDLHQLSGVPSLLPANLNFDTCNWLVANPTMSVESSLNVNHAPALLPLESLDSVENMLIPPPPTASSSHSRPEENISTKRFPSFDDDDLALASTAPIALPPPPPPPPPPSPSSLPRPLSEYTHITSPVPTLAAPSSESEIFHAPPRILDFSWQVERAAALTSHMAHETLVVVMVHRWRLSPNLLLVELGAPGEARSVVGEPFVLAVPLPLPYDRAGGTNAMRRVIDEYPAEVYARAVRNHRSVSPSLIANAPTEPGLTRIDVPSSDAPDPVFSLWMRLSVKETSKCPPARAHSPPERDIDVSRQTAPIPAPAATQPTPEPALPRPQPDENTTFNTLELSLTEVQRDALHRLQEATRGRSVLQERLKTLERELQEVYVAFTSILRERQEAMREVTANLRESIRLAQDSNFHDPIPQLQTHDGSNPPTPPGSDQRVARESELPRVSLGYDGGYSRLAHSASFQNFLQSNNKSQNEHLDAHGRNCEDESHLNFVNYPRNQSNREEDIIEEAMIRTIVLLRDRLRSTRVSKAMLRAFRSRWEFLVHTLNERLQTEESEQNMNRETHPSDVNFMNSPLTRESICLFDEICRKLFEEMEESLASESSHTFQLRNLERRDSRRQIPNLTDSNSVDRQEIQRTQNESEVHHFRNRINNFHHQNHRRKNKTSGSKNIQKYKVSTTDLTEVFHRPEVRNEQTDDIRIPNSYDNESHLQQERYETLDSETANCLDPIYEEQISRIERQHSRISINQSLNSGYPLHSVNEKLDYRDINIHRGYNRAENPSLNSSSLHVSQRLRGSTTTGGINKPHHVPGLSIEDSLRQSTSNFDERRLSRNRNLNTISERTVRKVASENDYEDEDQLDFVSRLDTLAGHESLAPERACMNPTLLRNARDRSVANTRIGNRVLPATLEPSGAAGNESAAISYRHPTHRMTLEAAEVAAVLPTSQNDERRMRLMESEPNRHLFDRLQKFE